MAILGQINPEHIDLKEMIMSSKVLDEMQKTQLLILATKVGKDEMINLYNVLNQEKEQLNSIHSNYQKLIEKYENLTAELDADAKEKAEADKILERLNNF